MTQTQIISPTTLSDEELAAALSDHDMFLFSRFTMLVEAAAARVSGIDTVMVYEPRIQAGSITRSMHVELTTPSIRAEQFAILTESVVLLQSGHLGLRTTCDGLRLAGYTALTPQNFLHELASQPTADEAIVQLRVCWLQLEQVVDRAQ